MSDSKRLAELLDYIKSEAELEFFSVALLSKDAQFAERNSVFTKFTTADFETESAWQSMSWNNFFK